MKTVRLVLCFILIFVSGGLWADSGVLAYVEGRVTLEKPGGIQQDAVIGDTVKTGDTLYTGADSFAEITLESGSTISIDTGSVFNMGEVSDPEVKSRKRGFFRVLLGSVSFKFRNLTREPDVGTPLVVCSVRGTDFTIYAAPDGASMTIVTDGLVEVSSGDESALLSADEGIEVVAGLGLGEPFDVRKGIVRYDAFVKQALQRIDNDPIGSLKNHTQNLLELIDEGEFFLKSWEINFIELEKAREMVNRIREEDGDEAGIVAYKEAVPALQDRALDLNRTYRHYLVSALYLRRFVLSSYYVRIRTKYLTDMGNPDWMNFYDAYNEMIKLYDTQLLPILSKEDL